MISSTILKKFVRSLIYSKGHNTVKSICEDLYYDKDYLPRVFKQISHRSAQNYMNYCRIIFVLYDFINGNNISSTRKKYHYTENALNKALHTYNLPSITAVKEDIKMNEIIRKEYEKIKLITILSESKKPIKAKELGPLYQYIQKFRESKEFCICSKLGPKGGYFFSANYSDIILCQSWINNWRKTMNIDYEFSLV